MLIKLKYLFIYLLPILSLFDAFYLFEIANLQVTLSILGLAIILILSLLTLKYKIENIFELFLLIFLLSFSFLFNDGASLNSFFLHLFFIGTYILCPSKKYNDKMLKWIKITLYAINIYSLIGVIQFLSNFTNLPYLELTWQGHMVTGYNTKNLVYMGNLIFMRAHAFYLEPSFLSQYCAIAIILTLYLYFNKIITKKIFYFSMILNFVGILGSVGGTGVIILCIVFLGWFLKYLKKKNKVFKFNTIILLFVIILLSFVIILKVPDNIFEFLFKRIGEVHTDGTSGGMRFSYPYKIMVNTWGWKIYGVGPGNENAAILYYYNGISQTYLILSSGYGKMGTEIGLFGLLLYLKLIFQNLNKKTYPIVLLLFTLPIVSGNMIPMSWCFLCFFKAESNYLNNLKQTIKYKSNNTKIVNN